MSSAIWTTMRRARADRDHGRIGGARERADLGARAAAVGHRERRRVEAQAVPFDDGRVAGLLARGQAGEPRRAGRVAGAALDVDLALLVHDAQQHGVVGDRRVRLVAQADLERPDGQRRVLRRHAGGRAQGEAALSLPAPAGGASPAAASPSGSAAAAPPPPATPEISIVRMPPSDGHRERRRSAAARRRRSPRRGTRRPAPSPRTGRARCRRS